MFKFILFFAIVINPLVLSGCLKDSFGPLEFKNPGSVQVRVQNSAKSAFSINDRPSIPVGGGDFLRSHFSDQPNNSSYSFDIKRQSTARCRVFYRVLRFPTASGDGHGSTIVVTEPTVGVFDAMTTDTTWIKVLSVQPL